MADKDEPKKAEMAAPWKPEPDEPPDEGDVVVMLDRDGILAADDDVMEIVKTPEWGGAVFVRSLSGRERDAYEADNQRRPKYQRLIDFRARFAVLVCCDAEGRLLFSTEDTEALTQKAAAPLDRIFDVGTRLNGLSEKDVEELAKNSGGAPSEGSGST